MFAGRTCASGRRYREESWRTSSPAGLLIQAPSRWTTDYQRGLLAHQRNTTWILPRTWYSVGGMSTHILCQQETDQLKATLTLKTHSYLIGWRRCQHWRFHRSQRLTDSRWGGTSTHHPTSTQLGKSFGRMDLCRFGCFILAVLCYFIFYYLSWFFYGLVFAEALLWTFHRLEYVKSCRRFRLLFWNGTVLPSVVGLSYDAHYFSKVFPETEGMCRADIWCNAASLRRWTSECFFYYFFEQKSFAVLE